MADYKMDGQGKPEKAEPLKVERDDAGDAQPPGKRGYAVGYKKPPKHTQFTAHTSGNPKGRPKRPLSMLDILNNELSAKMEVTVGKKKMRITKEVYLVRSTVNAAVRGDKAARKEILRLLEKHPERESPRSQEPNYSAALRDKIEQMAARYKEQKDEEEKRN